VTAGKPDPQVFLKAAQKIKREPHHCVVIEDAHVGIEAGKSGGMKVLAVATTHPADSLRDADAVFENLAGATVAKILAAVGLK
jgi:beta-phosphoglucomutase-like phosphatase (HAD superfamily)